jgi:hypothetical protein
MNYYHCEGDYLNIAILAANWTLYLIVNGR